MTMAAASSQAVAGAVDPPGSARRCGNDGRSGAGFSAAVANKTLAITSPTALAVPGLRGRLHWKIRRVGTAKDATHVLRCVRSVAMASATAPLFALPPAIVFG